MKTALAFPILSLISLSIPPLLSTMLPRCVKDCASSGTSCSVIGLLIFMILVLPLFAFSPNLAAVVSISDVFSGICFWLCEGRARSSVKSTSSNWSHGVHGVL